MLRIGALAGLPSGSYSGLVRCWRSAQEQDTGHARCAPLELMFLPWTAGLPRQRWAPSSLLPHICANLSWHWRGHELATRMLSELGMPPASLVS